MGRWLAAGAALLGLFSAAARGDDKEVASPRQFRISLRVAEIDVDSGKEKQVNRPCVTTLDGRPASFLIGGENALPSPLPGGGVSFEEFGFRAEFVVKSGKAGEIQIEAEFTNHEAGQETHHRAKYTDMVCPGKKLRREVYKDDGETLQYRVEYTVEDVTPPSEK